MFTIPIDSADAREQRELEQEAAEAEAARARRHAEECHNGWLGEDAEGRLRPCPECRPHLVALDDGRVVHHRTLARRQLEET